MPAAAAIPVPTAYIQVVAVQKLVVGVLLWKTGPLPPVYLACGSRAFIETLLAGLLMLALEQVCLKNSNNDHQVVAAKRS